MIEGPMIKLALTFIGLLATNLLLAGEPVKLSKEQSIQYSINKIKHLAPFVGEMADVCYLQSEKCGITDNAQIALLKWIAIEVRKVGTVNIDFDNNQQNFFIDGAIRMARTGSRRGDVIIFNTERLFKNTESGFRPLDLYEITAILIHELGHHQRDLFLMTGLKEPNHDELDIIAGIAVNYIKTRSRVSNFTLDDHPILDAKLININFEMFNGMRNRWARYFFDNGKGIEELSHQWKNRFQCPIRYQDGRIIFEGRPLSVFLRRLSAPKVHNNGDRLFYTQGVGLTTVSCVDDYEGVYDFFHGYENGKLNLFFDVKDDAFIFDSDNSFFTADMPAKYGRL